MFTIHVSKYNKVKSIKIYVLLANLTGENDDLNSMLTQTLNIIRE